ncbi:hypothetical protein AB0G79_32485 [Streptomyces sp. NPDC020807]|uniref:hypothetical protein n=1 Tax=Streptomyces sp. NPDC020807 TaxID=3155119 RepID=UPI0033DCB45F
MPAIAAAAGFQVAVPYPDIGKDMILGRDHEDPELDVQIALQVKTRRIGEIVGGVSRYQDDHRVAGHQPTAPQALELVDRQSDSDPGQPQPQPSARPEPPYPPTGPAADLLARLRLADPRLLLSAGDVQRLAPAVGTWLSRAATPAQITRPLTANLPPEPVPIHHPYRSTTRSVSWSSGSAISSRHPSRGGVTAARPGAPRHPRRL